MSMITPKRNILDRFLKVIGKDRAVNIGVAKDVEDKFGPYHSATLPKENFLRALLRARNAELPEGWAYLDDLTFSWESSAAGENNAGNGGRRDNGDQ